MNQRGFARLLIILVILMLIGGGIYLYQSFKSPTSQNNSNSSNPSNPSNPNPQTAANVSPSPVPQPSPTSTLTPISDEANWKTYKNNSIGFELEYPLALGTPGTNKKGNSQIINADGSESTPMVIYWKGLTLVSFSYSGDLETLTKKAKQIGPFSDNNIFLEKLKDFQMVGNPAIWYLTSSNDKPVKNGQEIYFVARNQAFLFLASLDIPEAQLTQILSTFKFTNQYQAIVKSPAEYPANPELENLAKAAAIKYFEKYKITTKNEEKILDFSIEEISQAHLKNNGLRFFINYSVKIPTDLTFSNWQAGNGSGMDKDGWIKNKTGYASAEKLNDEYQVQGIATGVGNNF